MNQHHGNQSSGDQNQVNKAPGDTTDSHQVAPAGEVDPRDAGLGYLVTAYADGQLAPEDVAKVEQILAKDPLLGARLAEIRLLQGALRTGLSVSPPPVQLEEMALGRILAAAARPQQPRRPVLTLMRLSMAALILLCVGITISSLATRREPPSPSALPSASPEDVVAVRDLPPGKSVLPSSQQFPPTSLPVASSVGAGPDTVAHEEIADGPERVARAAAPAGSIRANTDGPKSEQADAVTAAATPAPATTPAAPQAVPADLPGEQAQELSAVVAEKARPAASVPRALVAPQQPGPPTVGFMAVGVNHTAKPAADADLLVSQAFLTASERSGRRFSVRTSAPGARASASLRASLAALPEQSGPTASTLEVVLQQVAGAECPLQVTPAAAPAMRAPANMVATPMTRGQLLYQLLGQAGLQAHLSPSGITIDTASQPLDPTGLYGLDPVSCAAIFATMPMTSTQDERRSIVRLDSSTASYDRALANAQLGLPSAPQDIKPAQFIQAMSAAPLPRTSGPAVTLEADSGIAPFAEWAIVESGPSSSDELVAASTPAGLAIGGAQGAVPPVPLPSPAAPAAAPPLPASANAPGAIPPAPTTSHVQPTAGAAPGPARGNPSAQRSLVRSALVAFTVSTRGAGPEPRRALHLTVAVDCSPSMGEGGSLERVQAAVSDLIQRLDAKDTVALIACGQTARLVLPATPGNDHDRLTAAVMALRPGDAATAAGLDKAYDIAVASAEVGVDSQVLLATDGGMMDGAAGTVPTATAARHQLGISLAILECGTGFRGQHALESYAQALRGERCYLRDGAQERTAVVDHLLGEHRSGSVHDATILVSWNAQRVSHYRLIGCEQRQVVHVLPDGSNVGQLNDLLSGGSQATVLFEVLLTAHGSGSLGHAAVSYVDANGTPDITQSVALPDGDVGQASPSLRLAACAAAVGEFLQHGWWGNIKAWSAAALRHELAHCDQPQARDLALILERNAPH